MPDALDLTGRTIAITGATSGIGFAAARQLAARGARVIGVGRNPERIEAARREIQATHPHAQVEYVLADLSSLRQTQAAGEAIARLAGERLDALINNAASIAYWYTPTEDGFETQLAVTHLSAFRLTHDLLPLLRVAPAGRVVTVASRSHRMGCMHWDDLMMRRRYNPLAAYAQSKLANVLFTLEFNRREAERSAVRAYAADPGLVRTEIGTKPTRSLITWVWRIRARGGQTPDQGARTVVFLAADPSVSGAAEPYWRDCRPVAPSQAAQNPADAARLWELSERLTGIQAIP
jgi:NAD(P)-dependent dehydrogenase (short-subunit alcohol dehydrogenase family)